MKKNVLIVGYGSIGRRHAKILKKLKQIDNIFILSKQNNIPFKKVSNLQNVEKLNIDYIIISSETSKHFYYLNFFEKNLKNKLILVEKPLFEKYRKFRIINNKVFVGYNMRFNPIISFIKKLINKEKFWSINIVCGSFLPMWRKNIDYKKSSSANRKSGGGVLLDLSHELDYIQWLFGKIKMDYVYINKLSDLKISTEDFLSLSGKTKRSKRLQLELNYFSKNTTRRIIADGKNFSLNIDLIEKKIDIINKNKHQTIYKKFDRDLSYKMQHLSLLNGNFKDCCSFKDGLNLMKLIEKIRKF
jgi:CMP-N,N'-diacetyllegionaminic acid synthase